MGVVCVFESLHEITDVWYKNIIGGKTIAMYDIITRKLINVWAWFVVFWNPHVKLHMTGTKNIKRWENYITLPACQDDYVHEVSLLGLSLKELTINS